jgi:hypothetical protein
MGIARRGRPPSAVRRQGCRIACQRSVRPSKGHVSPEKLLLASGAPILVILSGWKSESIGNKILVGWNASREARRAVADALPFLDVASSVTLLVVDSEERAGRHGEEPGADKPPNQALGTSFASAPAALDRRASSFATLDDRVVPDTKGSLIVQLRSERLPVL